VGSSHASPNALKQRPRIDTERIVNVVDGLAISPESHLTLNELAYIYLFVTYRMNIQSIKNGSSPIGLMPILLATLAVGCSTDDSADDNSGDGIFDDDDLQMRTCNDDGGFLEVNVSGAIEATFDASAQLNCHSIGGFEAETRGVVLATTDDRELSFQVRGPLELGITTEDVPVEVFLFANDIDNDGTSDSWFGDCRFDITTFELFDDTTDWHDYYLGGNVRCDNPLEPFIGPDEAITVTGFSFVGVHTNITSLP